MEPVASAPSAPPRVERHPECRISRAELRCRIEEEGVDRVAARLAVSADALRAAIRGERRLRPERVLALRLGADVRALVEAFAEDRLRELGDG